VLAETPLVSNGFSFEPEITIKTARRGARIYEVPVSYHGRTYDEGKKIHFSDAVKMLLSIPASRTRAICIATRAPRHCTRSQRPRNSNLWMADTIRPFVGQRVLEIGSGIGNLTRALVAGRTRYTATTDLNPEHLACLVPL
jgi:hypothetical protein